MAREAHLTLKNELSEVARLAERIEAFGAEHRIAPEAVFRLTLVLDEMVTNVISYAFDEGASHDVEVTIRIDGGLLTAVVADDGRPFDPLSQTAEPDVGAALEDRPVGGLGVHLARAMTKTIDYRREAGRNIVTMTLESN